MEQELTVGILRLTASWQIILDQTGASYVEVSSNEDRLVDRYSLIIINRSVTNREFELIKEYIYTGGAVIDTGYLVTSLVSGTITKKKYSCIIPKDLPFPCPLGIIDVYSNVSVFSKAQYCNKSLFLDSYGQGVLCFLGLDIDKLLFDIRTKRKEFSCPLPRFPHEEVSRVAKGEVTRLIFFLMRYLHTSRHIPFVHKWFFPGKSENVFLFRIDSDFGTRKQVQQWYEIAKASNINITWFLHVAAHEGWLDTFSDFDGHEIAVHAYDHFTSKKFIPYKKNIERAMQVLKASGLTPQGHSAPYGLWNKAINNTCENLGFLYSTEFSYAYDSLPLNPVVANIKSTVLQIPIHPICIGNLCSVKADEKKIIDYFKYTTQRLIAQYNPIILYDHIVHDYPEVLQEVFKNINALSIPSLTFSEYARWWMQREQTHFSAQLNSTAEIKIETSDNNKQCNVCIWIDDNTYILADKNMTVPFNKDHFDQSGYKREGGVSIELSMPSFNWRVALVSQLNKILWRKYA